MNNLNKTIWIIVNGPVNESAVEALVYREEPLNGALKALSVPFVKKDAYDDLLKKYKQGLEESHGLAMRADEFEEQAQKLNSAVIRYILNPDWGIVSLEKAIAAYQKFKGDLK